MRLKYKAVLIICSVLFGSCSTDIEQMSSPERLKKVVEFNSVVSNNSHETKAMQTYWEADDNIGVYMKKTGDVLSSGSILNKADNVIYTTTGDGHFTPKSLDDAISFPNDGNADFIAYYPQREISGFIYKVDITDQSSPQDIDLLYSDNLKNLDSDENTPSFIFSHQLVMLELNIIPDTQLTNLSGLIVTIAGIHTQADFDITNGNLISDNTSISEVTCPTKANGSSLISNIILIPDNGANNREVTFSHPNGKTFKWVIPTETIFEKGKKYTYNITL